jgi:hypothetical protein
MQGRACGCLELRGGGDDRESRPDRALGVVLMRERIAEISEYAVAHIFRDEAAVAFDQTRAASVIRGNDLAHVLGIVLLGKRRRTDKIAEHDGQLPPLSGVRFEARNRGGRRGWARRRERRARRSP